MSIFVSAMHSMSIISSIIPLRLLNLQKIRKNLKILKSLQKCQDFSSLRYSSLLKLTKGWVCVSAKIFPKELEAQESFSPVFWFPWSFSYHLWYCLTHNLISRYMVFLYLWLSVDRIYSCCSSIRLYFHCILLWKISLDFSFCLLCEVALFQLVGYSWSQFLCLVCLLSN